MADANPIRDALEGLGPTNRIARQLANRLDLAEDAFEETLVINGELQEIFDALVGLAQRFEAAIVELAAEGVEAVEDHANNRCGRCGSDRWVAVSLDEGATRRRQCVPCGFIAAEAIRP